MDSAELILQMKGDIQKLQAEVARLSAESAATAKAMTNKASHLDTSMWRLVSFGIAAENKTISSRMLQVYPIEIIPFIDGEIAVTSETIQVKGVDAASNPYTASMVTTNSVNAKWIGSTNRLTAPDVRRGERVLLWQYENFPVFYWESLGMDDPLRKLETVTFAISAEPDESVTELDADNTYYVSLSSHQGLITLSTSQKNGEYCTYNMQFNLMAGTWALQDSLGNYLQIDSANTSIMAQNADGAYINLNQQNVFITAPKLLQADCTTGIINTQTLTLNVSDKMNVNVENAITTSAGSIATTVTTGDITTTVTTGNINTTVSAGNIVTTVPAGTVTSTALGFQFNGPVQMSGILGVVGIATVGGLAAAGGAMTVTAGTPGVGGGSAVPAQIAINAGSFKITANTDVTGALTNNGFFVGNTHFHTSTAPGDPTSNVAGPPAP